MARDRARARAARTIGVDLVAAEVVEALRAAGTRPVLLKGPTLARLLYEPRELRSYTDVDLLVAPEDEPGAADALRRLGFERLVDAGALRGHRALHAHEWTRAGSPSVDLHRTLPGAAADPAVVVSALTTGSEPISVAGVDAESPPAHALLVHVALHAAHHGPLSGKALADLRRACERVPLATWAVARDLAERIDALPAFAAGLRLAPAGARLAAELSLTDSAPVEVRLKASGAPPLAVGIDWLLRTPGLGARLRLVRRTALPAPSALRLWRPLARGGHDRLIAAYLSHPFWLARHAVPSLLAVRRARRAMR